MEGRYEIFINDYDFKTKDQIEYLARKNDVKLIWSYTMTKEDEEKKKYREVCAVGSGGAITSWDREVNQQLPGILVCVGDVNEAINRRRRF